VSLVFFCLRVRKSKGAFDVRKVVAALFISLDGVVEAPNKWQFDNFDEDMGATMGAQLATMDTVLLGRVTYQEWAPYWPTSTDEPFASFINNTPKYVVSTTLNIVEWQHSTLLKGDLAEGIATLKQQPGRNIGVTGSPSLVRSLLQNGLLDELTLLVHPVIVGRGKRLFKDRGDLKRLKLVESKATRTGVLIATYTPA
jgi:dihydrofolate reductase